MAGDEVCRNIVMRSDANNRNNVSISSTNNANMNIICENVCWVIMDEDCNSTVKSQTGIGGPDGHTPW